MRNVGEVRSPRLCHVALIGILAVQFDHPHTHFITEPPHVTNGAMPEVGLVAEDVAKSVESIIRKNGGSVFLQASRSAGPSPDR